jgi:Lar family restriction alleviation protein
MYNSHDKDRLLKRCPFCGGKAKLRSPKKLRTSHSAICSDVSCTKCDATKASWPWPKTAPYDELPRKVQDNQVIKKWNQRSKHV